MRAASRGTRRRVADAELGFRQALCLGSGRRSLLALVLQVDEPDRPLRRIGWRQEFAKRVEHLLELGVGRQTVSDSFGEGRRSSGRHPMLAVL